VGEGGGIDDFGVIVAMRDDATEENLARERRLASRVEMPSPPRPNFLAAPVPDVARRGASVKIYENFTRDRAVGNLGCAD
jgi:hypothetical protein